MSSTSPVIVSTTRLRWSMSFGALAGAHWVTPLKMKSAPSSTSIDPLLLNALGHAQGGSSWSLSPVMRSRTQTSGRASPAPRMKPGSTMATSRQSGLTGACSHQSEIPVDRGQACSGVRVVARER